MKKCLIFLLLFLIPMGVNAATNKGSIKCDKISFKEYAQFACRINIESNFAFDKIEFTLDTTAGLYLEDFRSNYDALWKVEASENKLTATTKRNMYVNGLQEFGIILIQSAASGNQEIKISDMVLSNSNNSKTLKINEFKQDIQILSSENKLKGIFIDSKIIARFDSHVASYHLEIGKNKTDINLSAVPIDENAKINGVGELKLEPEINEIVLPLTVTSASGANKVYYLVLTRVGIKQNATMVDDITITDDLKNAIDFKFKPSTYEYNIEVANNVKSLDISVAIPDSLSLVKNYGSRKINLEDGDNLVIIKVKDENGQIRHYILNITRVLSDKSANCYLKSLVIQDYNLKFNKKVKRYSLAIKPNQTKLEISAIPDFPKSEVSIIGNNHLKEGSVVKIMVTAENGSRLTYELTISYQKSNYIRYLIILAVILGLLILINEQRRRKLAKIEIARIAEEKRLAEAAAKLAEIKAKKKKPVKKTVTKTTVKKKPIARKPALKKATTKVSPTKKNNSTKKPGTTKKTTKK